MTQAETTNVTGVDAAMLRRYERNRMSQDERFRKLWEQLVRLASGVNLLQQMENVISWEHRPEAVDEQLAGSSRPQ